MTDADLEIRRLVRQTFGDTPDSVGSFVGWPVTLSLEKETLLALIWYLQHEMEERRKGNERVPDMLRRDA